MPTLIKPATLALLACTTSCATRTADLRSADEVSPRLISCGESIAPVDKTRQHTSVELRYTVSSEGRVEPGSLRLVPNLNASLVSESELAAARAVALSCVYAPATRNGDAVAVSLSRWFTVDATEAAVRRP
jgi:hypothetical protein